MRIPPKSVIASWPPPNHTEPETRGPANKIVGIVGFIIMTFVVAIRLYTRQRILNGLKWDDILIIVAYIPAIIFTVLGLISESALGLNRHMWDVPSNSIIPWIQISLTSQVIFDMATSLTKLSILALIYRLARASSKSLRVVVLVLGAFITVNYIVFLFISIFQCRPLSDYWNLSRKPKNCISETAHLLTAACINTATDFITASLPVVVVFRLQKDTLSRRQMIIANVLFGVGFLAGIVGAVRTYFIWETNTNADFDMTWHAQLTWLASILELDIGIICASIPATKPFFACYMLHRCGSTNPASQYVGGSRRTSKGSELSQSSRVVPFVLAAGGVAAFVIDVKDNDGANGVGQAQRKLLSQDLNKPLPVLSIAAGFKDNAQ